MAAAKSLADLLVELGMQLEPDTLKVLKILEKKQAISEDVIAEKLKLKVNAARKLLYALHTKGITAYTKKRDPKKKWWYLYYWSIDKDRVQMLVNEYKRRLLEQKYHELETEKQFAFECESCTEKFTYEDALDSEFTCPKCGALLVEAKPTKTILKLQREIAILEKQLQEAAPKPVARKKAKPKKKPAKKSKSKQKLKKKKKK